MSTLNGVPITDAVITIPAWGVWWADVEVSEPETLTGAATLVIGGQTFVGTITSGGVSYGRARYRVAGGAGRWGEVVTSKSYANDAGVKASLIIGDAAAEVGETVAGAPADRVGTHYVRASTPASDVLHTETRDAWYVDVDGVTRFGTRSAYAYAGDGTTRVITPDRVVEIATDDVTTIRPGVTALGVTAVDVEIKVQPSSLRVTLYATAMTDAWRALVDRLIPGARYLGTWEYRVISQSSERLNLQVVRVSSGMPDLQRVPVRPGVPGFRATWPVGSFCLVSFVNGDPGRPVVVGGDAPDSPGFIPDAMTAKAADMRVDVLESLIKLGSLDDVDLDFVALAQKVDTAVTNIRTWANTHTHSGVTTGGGVSGVPAALLSAQSSTAAINVKGS